MDCDKLKTESEKSSYLEKLLSQHLLTRSETQGNVTHIHHSSNSSSSSTSSTGLNHHNASTQNFKFKDNPFASKEYTEFSNNPFVG